MSFIEWYLRSQCGENQKLNVPSEQKITPIFFYKLPYSISVLNYGFPYTSETFNYFLFNVEEISVILIFATTLFIRRLHFPSGCRSSLPDLLDN